MKKILALLTMLALLGTPALAGTNIWTWVQNEGGYSSYQEETWVGGYDYSEPGYEYTGFVMEGFENEGTISMDKELHTDGDWILEERKIIIGTGETEIYKHVDVWTEDTRTTCGGKLRWPTEVWVEYSFSTPKPFYDADTFYAIVDEPPAQHCSEPGNHAYYDKVIETDEDFYFGQKVGIGDFPSDFEPREQPEFPDMCWFEWL